MRDNDFITSVKRVPQFNLKVIETNFDAYNEDGWQYFSAVICFTEEQFKALTLGKTVEHYSGKYVTRMCLENSLINQKEI